MDLKNRMHEPATVFYYLDLMPARHAESRHFTRLDSAIRWIMEEATMAQRAQASLRLDFDELALSNFKIRTLYFSSRPGDGERPDEK